jgi:protein ImuB
LPVLELSERLGQQGVRLHELARGERHRALVLAQPSTHFAEEMEVDDAVEALEPLSFLLGRLLDQLCARLDARAVAVQAIHVRFELQPSFEKDFQRQEESRTKPPAKQYAKTLGLPVPMRNPKTLLKLLRLQLQGDPPKAPIQKITLTADAAAPRVAQAGLFVPGAPDPEKLELTLARLTKLVGESNVGSAELLDTHRFDHFRIARFVVPAESQKIARKTARRAPVAAQHRCAPAWQNVNTPPRIGFRVVRPSVPIRLELREEKPARLWLRGSRGTVVTASGPWRSSGDWWQEEPWYQDEWDLEVEFDSARSQNASRKDPLPEYGVLRIYFDALRQSWFLRGIYD